MPRSRSSSRSLCFSLASLLLAYCSQPQYHWCTAFHHGHDHGHGVVPKTRPSTIRVSTTSPFRQSRSRYKSSSQLSSASTNANVNVYNNVADDGTCIRLHQLALETTKRSPDGSFLFHRRNSDSNNNNRPTPIETFIDQILLSLNDTSPIVEYWTRNNYINMDAHADIDENTLKQDGVLRCPRNGHVFYMQVANSNNNNDDNNNNNDDPTDNEKQTMGPTVVFPSRKVAWGSVSPKTIPSPSSASYNSEVNLEERVVEYIVDVENYWDEEQKRQFGYDTDDKKSSTMKEHDEMAIVPALTGRLLRFDGAAFHAVPKPPDRYLLSEKELTAVLEVEDEEDCEDDDDYWDDDYEDDDDDDEEDESDNPNQRSVLLFNTWPEGSFGPMGVLPDPIVDAVPDGISFDDDDEEEDATSGGSSKAENEQWKQWQDTYGDNFEKVWCNPFEDWMAEDVEELNNEASSSRDVRIPLMGNPSRRGCAANKSVLRGSVSNDSFHDRFKVSLVTLEKGND